MKPNFVKVIFIGLMLIVGLMGEESTPINESTPPRFISLLKEGKNQNVVFYGTSLTAAGAWTRLLKEELSKKYPTQLTFHNGAKSGQNSQWGIENLDANVIQKNPDVVFIEFSMNDAVLRFNISKQQSEKNLETMIDRILKALPECEIILEVMNPSIDLPEKPTSRPALEQYYDVYRKVAQKRSLYLIDHMPAWQEILNRSQSEYLSYVPDAVHPNEPGCQKIIMPTLRKALGLSE